MCAYIYTHTYIHTTTVHTRLFTAHHTCCSPHTEIHPRTHTDAHTPTHTHRQPHYPHHIQRICGAGSAYSWGVCMDSCALIHTGMHTPIHGNIHPNNQYACACSFALTHSHRVAVCLPSACAFFSEFLQSDLQNRQRGRYWWWCWESPTCQSPWVLDSLSPTRQRCSPNCVCEHVCAPSLFSSGAYLHLWPSLFFSFACDDVSAHSWSSMGWERPLVLACPSNTTTRQICR